MSRVITFSRFFPSYHPKKGQPTYFVEQIHNSIFDDLGGVPYEIGEQLQLIETNKIKHHTIRAGKRWKVGDKFSPRVWSGKPYASKQIQFAPDIEIKNIWDIGLRIRGDFKEFYCNDCDLTATSINAVSSNDGLDRDDFLSWFTKPFEGQIICWNENVHY
jgi:hypothetical protein